MDIQQKHCGPYCLYPPRLADEVEVTEQVEADVTRYVVRNTATSRYFLLKQPQYKIFRQFDGTLKLSEVASGGPQGDGPRASITALKTFLTKLDSYDLLARGGEGYGPASRKVERGLYLKIHLFDPTRLLAWLDRTIGWALRAPYIKASFALMMAVTFGLFARWPEVTAYTAYVYAEYGLAPFVLTILTILALHEFAHGLACKHFGGEVREVGVLMVYYVFPAFYCNVTDIYRIGRRRERLWVIFAGIYWQMLISAMGGLIWLLATPYTLLADFSLLVLFGGTFNIIINCNPLIKLDGYYALSQAVGVENLQARSSEYVRALYGRLTGTATAKALSAGRPVLFISYWICSIVYSVILIWFILGLVSNELIDKLGLAGVAATLLLAMLLTEKWWKPFYVKVRGSIASALKGVSAMSAQQALEKTESDQGGTTNPARRRRLPARQTIIKGAVAFIIVVALVAPWEASTGSDCALLLPPGREGVARSNTDAVLADIYVQPGDTIAEGAKIARLTNPEIEDRLTQLNAEIDRLNTNNSRIEEEMRIRSENMLSANFKELERKRFANELKDESSQIARAGVGGQAPGVEASVASASTRPPSPGAQLLPPSLAVLQSEIELKQTELDHNRREVERYKKLVDQGLLGAQQFDRAIAAMRINEKELQGAKARLEAALVDHRRLTTGVETSSLVAETEARAARSSFESLIAEMHANRQQVDSLKARRDLLQREYEGMQIVSPKAGVVLGDDLRKMIGRRYSRGEEICRIGELEKFLLRIDVSEREIANVRLDSAVRFKLKTVPGRTFTGYVSKINAEPVPNQYGQRFYPVEVLVENSDGMLRPGMTGFARISFGRQSVGLIIAEKLWQALRPELWLF